MWLINKKDNKLEERINAIREVMSIQTKTISSITNALDSLNKRISLQQEMINSLSFSIDLLAKTIIPEYKKKSENKPTITKK